MILKNFLTVTKGGTATSFSNTNVNVGGSSNMVPPLDTAAFRTDGTGGYYSIGATGVYVNVGFGSTAENYNDYKLADDNIVDNNLLLTYISNSWSVAGQGTIFIVSTIYRNDTANNITVTEIGICDKSYSTNNSAANALITRKVLDTPVVLEPGKMYSFSYRISF